MGPVGGPRAGYAGCGRQSRWRVPWRARAESRAPEIEASGRRPSTGSRVSSGSLPRRNRAKLFATCRRAARFRSRSRSVCRTRSRADRRPAEMPRCSSRIRVLLLSCAGVRSLLLRARFGMDPPAVEGAAGPASGRFLSSGRSGSRPINLSLATKLLPRLVADSLFPALLCAVRCPVFCGGVAGT